MASMLTAVTGTKMDTAKTFQVNTTVSPDVTHITETMKKLKLEYKRGTNGKTITEKEMEYTIKRLKRNKSLGPDKIPNEIFIEANKETKKIYQEIMNTVYKQETIPERWQEGEIKRLYKGKGQKGKCSNERGITLASNVGKVFERIINERVKKEVYITEAQGGGIPGNATVDHLVALKEAANQILKRGKTAYMIFLDVQKAYDKAWLDAILYALYRNGVGKKNLEIIRKLNTGLTAQIQTKYGLTRKITIRDSIRQGGVLSVIEYATLMDEITKEINKNDMGLELRNGEKLRDLLWMDDVLLIHENAKEVQKMLDITNHIALKNHIEFGAPKCKIVKLGRGPKTHINLNDVILEEVPAYKYLGNMINNKGNLEAQIETLKGKIHAATQEIMVETGNKEFHGIRMEAVWQLLEATIIPIITYGSEAWEPTKKESEQLETIFNKALKTILHLPQQTPTNILLAETGNIPIELIIKKKKLMHANRIITSKNRGLVQIVTEGDSIWRENIKKIQQEYNITEEELTGGKEELKKKIDRENRNQFEMNIKKEAETKSKTKHWLQMNQGTVPKVRPEYMNKLNRRECSTIIKIRSRMIPVKSNMMASHNNQICRMCNDECETQEHLLAECKEINLDKKIEYKKAFNNNDMEALKTIAEKTKEILNLLENTQKA